METTDLPAAPEASAPKVPVAVLDMCSGKKCCPVAEEFADHSMVLRDSETGAAIPFTAEQRDRLRIWLNERP